MLASNNKIPPAEEESNLPPQRAPIGLRLVAFIAALIVVSLARGQVIQLDGGSSSLFQATGASVQFHGSDYDGWVGAGSLAGQPTAGAFVRARWRGSTISLGDDVIPFRLPTDIFDNSHYFLGRGAGIAKNWENISLSSFAGATSTGFSAPFFRGARAENGVGLLFVDAKLTPKLHVFSRNIISNRQTSISGLEWQPQAGFKVAFSGGVGANEGYVGSSLSAERRWMSLKIAYILPSTQFRRVVVRSPVGPENDRENVLLTVHPRDFITLSAGRFNLLQPPTNSGPGLRATVDQYFASMTAARFTITGSLFNSHVRQTSTRGTALSVGRDFKRRVQAMAYLFHSRSGRAPSATSLLFMLRETISPHLSILEVANHANGRTSFSFGGDLISNFASIGVEYQTVYVPFRTANPFRQALVMNVRLQPVGNFQVNAGTYIAPDGSVKYTAYGNSFLYGSESKPAPRVSFKFPRYIVRGRVVDEGGQTVPWAAVRIGGEVVFTDSQGEFYVRMKKSRVSDVDVLLGDFLVPGHFEVISCPPTVTPSMEDRADEILIILRQVKTGPPSADPYATS